MQEVIADAQARRFVILSQARSGSSLLSETLDSHPQILCHGEIFHPDPRWHVRGSFSSLSEDEIRSRRLEDPASFIEAVFSQVSYSLVGCKMWYAQNPTWCDEIMASESYLKIILERENKLAQFSSGMAARRTGVWNILPSEQVKRPVGIQLEFDEGQFDRFLQYQSDHFRIYKENAKGLVFEVTYADLMGGNFSGVQEFLGVEVLPLKPMKAKLYSRDILKRFKPEYEGAILRKLKAIQREEWVFE